VLVGALHGLTGAAAVLMLAPAALSGDLAQGLGWVGGFTLGSTVAMAALTGALGAAALALSQRALGRAVAAASLGSVALGITWLVS
jgi:hypothetical protein